MDAITVFLADYLIFVVVLLALFVLYKTKKKWEFILAVALAVILAWDLVALFEALYYHPRPFVSQNIEPLVVSGTDSGFPSQHTAIAMALATVIYFYNRSAAALALGLTLLIGVGRVLAHVHSWIDILGGLMVGVAAGFAGYQVARWFLSGLIKKPKSTGSS